MPQRFPLEPMWGMFLLGLLMFGGGAVLFIYKAATIDSYASNVRVYAFDLGPSSARIVYIAMAACSIALAALGVVGNLRLISGKQAVVLDDETATFPGTFFSPKPKTFAYKDIRSVVQQNVMGNVFVTVTHRTGKVAVAKRTLADGAFDTIVTTLETRAEVGPRARST